MNSLLDIFRESAVHLVLAFLAAVLPLLAKVLADVREAKTAKERVLDAERQAFRTIPESFLDKTKELADSQDALEQRAKELAELVDRAQGALRVGILFDVYSKQIEKYQTETQARAGWSFIFAIISMFAGLGFVIWGGMQAVVGHDWESKAVGATVSGIGAGLSAFITKTFLDVHRLSLTQLNRYFRQPVLNSHVLTAQRLADQLPGAVAKEEAYRTIIQKLVHLIREDEPESARNEDIPAARVRSSPKRARRVTSETGAANPAAQADA